MPSQNLSVGIDNASWISKVNDCYARLREKVNLPLREYDEGLYIVSDLCVEQGRLAFMEGVKVGMLLMQELTNR